jgi:hypothetical protein
MTTEREKLYNQINLKLSKRVKNGKLNASLFCNCGIPEGTICGWVKTEDEWHSYAAFTEEAGMQRGSLQLIETVM